MHIRIYVIFARYECRIEAITRFSFVRPYVSFGGGVRKSNCSVYRET